MQRLGQDTVERFARLYLMPGVGHGTGPFHPAIDSLAVLEQWEEGDHAPQTLIVSDLNSATSGRTRPLCRYPAWPRYGSGDVNSANSFSCVTQ